MPDVVWGVLVGGSKVVHCVSGLRAFRLEAELREAGEEAVVVWFDGLRWRPVPVDSVARPDPVPPPQAPWWRRRWAGGKFRRRDARG